MWWFYALVSAFFASLTAIFAKMGVENVNSNLATAIRTMVVMIMVWILVFARGEARNIGSLSRQNLFYLTISGLCTGISWLFYFKAIQIGDVSKVAPIDKLSMALTIILAMIFLGESINWQTALGAGLIIAGTIIIISY